MLRDPFKDIGVWTGFLLPKGARAMRRIDQNRSKSMSNQATSVVFHVFPFQSRPGQKPHRCTSHGRMNKVMQNEKDKIWWNKNRMIELFAEHMIKYVRYLLRRSQKMSVWPDFAQFLAWCWAGGAQHRDGIQAADSSEGASFSTR